MFRIAGVTRDAIGLALVRMQAHNGTSLAASCAACAYEAALDNHELAMAQAKPSYHISYIYIYIYIYIIYIHTQFMELQ